MKFLLVIILMISCNVNVFSQFFRFDDRYYYYDKIEKDINASIRFLVPPPHESSFGFAAFNAGISYGVVQEHFYIGIAGDMALGFDWLRLFAGNNDDNNSSGNTEKENYQIGLSIGLRLYNVIQIRNVRIWSFIGSDFLFALLPMPYIGLELTFKFLGAEYAYFFPIHDGNPTRHRISLIFHMLVE